MVVNITAEEDTKCGAPMSTNLYLLSKKTKNFSFEISCLHILCYKRIIDFKMVSKKQKNLVFESEGAYENNNENRVSK